MSLLLRHLEASGLLAPADLEAATRHQRSAGGSLDTALLELGLVTPLQLDEQLQAACGLPGAPVRLLERGPTRPWEHVPKDLVDIGWVIPLASEGGQLVAAVHPDLPDAKLGQLYRLIRGFSPVVAPECCLAKVAAERSGAILSPRYAMLVLDYLQALRDRDAVEPAAPPRPLRGPSDTNPVRPASGKSPAARPVDAPRPLHAVPSDRSVSAALTAASALPAGEAGSTRPAPAAEAGPKDSSLTLARPASAAEAGPKDSSLTLARPADAAATADPKPTDDGARPTTSAAQRDRHAPTGASRRNSVPSPAPAPAAAPATPQAHKLAAARATLASARERDRITEALVRAAVIIAPRVGLFGVKREGLRVLAAPGSALRLSEGLVIPLPEGGPLDGAVSGATPLTALTEPSLSFAVGQPLGIPCVFEPVLAGGRTVLMLYLDRAGVAFDPLERATLRELCDTARQSLESLLRLLGWVVPAGPPTETSPADRTPPRPHLAQGVFIPPVPTNLPPKPAPSEPAGERPRTDPLPAAPGDATRPVAADSGRPIRSPYPGTLVARTPADLNPPPGDSASRLAADSSTRLPLPDAAAESSTHLPRPDAAAESTTPRPADIAESATPRPADTAESTNPPRPDAAAGPTESKTPEAAPAEPALRPTTSSPSAERPADTTLPSSRDASTTTDPAVTPAASDAPATGSDPHAVDPATAPSPTRAPERPAPSGRSRAPREPIPGDGVPVTRMRGNSRGGRGRAVITLVNPVRRDEPAPEAPTVEAPPTANPAAPSPAASASADPAAPAEPFAPDSPLVARFAALAAALPDGDLSLRPAQPPPTADLTHPTATPASAPNLSSPPGPATAPAAGTAATAKPPAADASPTPSADLSSPTASPAADLSAPAAADLSSPTASPATDLSSPTASPTTDLSSPTASPAAAPSSPAVTPSSPTAAVPSSPTASPAADPPSPTAADLSSPTAAPVDAAPHPAVPVVSSSTEDLSLRTAAPTDAPASLRDLSPKTPQDPDAATDLPRAADAPPSDAAPPTPPPTDAAPTREPSAPPTDAAPTSEASASPPASASPASSVPPTSSLTVTIPPLTTRSTPPASQPPAAQPSADPVVITIPPLTARPTAPPARELVATIPPLTARPSAARAADAAEPPPATGPQGQVSSDRKDPADAPVSTAADSPEAPASVPPAPESAPAADLATSAVAAPTQAPTTALHMPHLIAPPGARPTRRRGGEAASEPVLVIPKTLRRATAMTATPHPMARRGDRNTPVEPAPAAAPAPTLSIPATLLSPRGGRRRGKNEPRPEAPPPMTLPKLVREAGDAAPPAEPAAQPVPADISAADPEPVPETSAVETGPVDPVPETQSTPSESMTAPAEPPTVEDELDAVIEAFLQSPNDWGAAARLRALDARGLARLAARFPGPIDIANANTFPPPSAHGPLLRACVELGQAIAPHVLELFASPRPQIRFYAAFLFQELRDPRCLRPLGDLAFDPDPDVRLIATRVLESYSRVPDFLAVSARIRAELDHRDRDRQLLATEAAGTLRDTYAVPRLIDLLAVRDNNLREAALEALCSITAKHHGYRAARWRAWYADHGDESRVEWVMDGLRHRDVAVRRWAADELVRITGQRIPFPVEGDRRSRDAALKLWQEWWESSREEFGRRP